jgi:hypothetical protein
VGPEPGKIPLLLEKRVTALSSLYLHSKGDYGSAVYLSNYPNRGAKSMKFNTFSPIFGQLLDAPFLKRTSSLAIFRAILIPLKVVVLLYSLWLLWLLWLLKNAFKYLLANLWRVSVWKARETLSDRWVGLRSDIHAYCEKVTSSLEVNKPRKQVKALDGLRVVFPVALTSYRWIEMPGMRLGEYIIRKLYKEKQEKSSEKQSQGESSEKQEEVAVILQEVATR